MSPNKSPLPKTRQMGACASCGAECGFGDKYCMKCGANIRRRYKRCNESPMLKPSSTPNISLNTIRLDQYREENAVRNDKSSPNVSKKSDAYAAGIGDLIGIYYSKKGTAYAQCSALRVLSLTQKKIYMDGLHGAHKQTGGTCYANAIATAIRATESRIVGRNPPSHSKLVTEFIEKYGSNGANTYSVLKAECSKRSLKCKQVGMNGAKNAILRNRVVVATFHLCDKQWTNFSKYFMENGTAIASKMAIGEISGIAKGHAVCIIGFNTSDNCWKIQNSWGEEFADNGYFRVELGAIQMTFYDVFYRIVDLTKQDLENFRLSQKE